MMPSNINRQWQAKSAIGSKRARPVRIDGSTIS
jgi:hypothetical protein